MYAVVSSGGKQYRVEAGTELLVEKLAVEPGAAVTFDRVLLVGDGDDVTVGTPLVTGASVSGTVLRAERGPKIVIFKFKQKVKYRRRTGHRQDLVRVRIDEISANGKRAKAEQPESAAKPVPEAETKAPAPNVAASSASTDKPKRTTRARTATKAETAAKADDADAKPKRTPRTRTAKAETTDAPKPRASRARTTKPADKE